MAERLKVYRLADDAAWTLWHSPMAREVSSHEESAAGLFRTARVVLTCRDGDGEAEEFSFLPPGKSEGPDFGFAYDLNRDGRIDYLVFNGGPMFGATSGQMVWMNYHWIDTDADGRIDVVVYNDVDRNGDGLADEGWTAWVYDRNHDGIPDDAEYLSASGGSVPLERTADHLLVKRAMGTVKVSLRDPTYLGSLTEALAAIQRGMR
jgi:hypothetical protein